MAGAEQGFLHPGGWGQILAVAQVLLAFIPAGDAGADEVVDAVIDDAVSETGTGVNPAATTSADEDSQPTLCGGQSFTPTTGLKLANGTSIPLDQVEVGDKVLATNPETGKTRAEPVTAIWANYDTDVLDGTLHTANGDTTIDTTEHHYLFYDVTAHSWAEAEKLHADHRLYTADGTLATVVGLVIIPGAAEMWDLCPASASLPVYRAATLSRKLTAAWWEPRPKARGIGNAGAATALRPVRHDRPGDYQTYDRGRESFLHGFDRVGIHIAGEQTVIPRIGIARGCRRTCPNRPRPARCQGAGGLGP